MAAMPQASAAATRIREKTPGHIPVVAVSAISKVREPCCCQTAQIRIRIAIAPTCYRAPEPQNPKSASESQPAPKYHTKGCSRSSVDSPGARTLVFAALEPFSSCEFRASIARTPFGRYFGALPKMPFWTPSRK